MGSISGRSLSGFTDFNQGLLKFLQSSPSSFHAAEQIRLKLIAGGFIALNEADDWQLEPGKRYVITRNDSSVIAFIYGHNSLIKNGISMLGAHTDSPCLKVKPHPELTRRGYYQLGVEVYGGALLAPWFDRDLSIAGRVSYRNQQNEIDSVLVDFRDAIAFIPSLAIHLDREANNSRSINPQKDIVPVLLQIEEAALAPDFKTLLKQRVDQEYPELNSVTILDYEMNLYDTQAPALVGLQKQFIASARLDNLLSCYVGLSAILNADNQESSLFIATDHEEVGSTSCCGAKGPMLQQFLERLLPDPQERARCIDRSVMISADNAHGVHPNFLDKHDENHGPILNKGPVIKINANQRYATTSDTSGLFRSLCELEQIPVQAFVARTDMGCGSTIGPIVSSEVGVKTVDVGVPTFAMHSIREIAGDQDAWLLYRVVQKFFSGSVKLG
jgi:aspartyl aminopeptidase